MLLGVFYEPPASFEKFHLRKLSRNPLKDLWEALVRCFVNLHLKMFTNILYGPCTGSFSRVLRQDPFRAALQSSSWGASLESSLDVFSLSSSKVFHKLHLWLFLMEALYRSVSLWFSSISYY